MPGFLWAFINFLLNANFSSDFFIELTASDFYSFSLWGLEALQNEGELFFLYVCQGLLDTNFWKFL